LSSLKSMTELRVCASPTRLLVAGREPGRSVWRLIDFDRTVASPSNLAATLRHHAEAYTDASVAALFRENGAASTLSFKSAAAESQDGSFADTMGRPRTLSKSEDPSTMAMRVGDPAAQESGPPVSLLSFFSGLLVPASTPAVAAPAASTSSASISANASDFFSFNAVAMLGAIAFTRGYYLLFATRREAVGEICGHAVYSPRGIEFVSVYFDASAGRAQQNFGRWLLTSVDAATTIETRYQSLFLSTDYTKNFYFSPTYDLSRSLQQQACASSRAEADQESIFEWTAFLRSELGGAWTTPLIHGFFRQVTFSVLAAVRVRLTLLARRSRVFAGARYLKRGANSEGAVANDVETEQIVEDDRGACSAFLQLRGSVPARWTQRTAIAVPRPPIVLQPRDPTHAPARRHIAALFERYGAPLLVLNLVKKREKGAARESAIGREWSRAAAALNKELPPDVRMQYLSIDYTAVVKTRRLNILAAFRDAGRWAVENTGFFCNVIRSPVSTSAAVHLPSSPAALSSPRHLTARLIESEENDDTVATMAAPRAPAGASRSVYASARRTISSAHVLSSTQIAEGDVVVDGSELNYVSQLNMLASRRVIIFRPPPRNSPNAASNGNCIRWLSSYISLPKRNLDDISLASASGVVLGEELEVSSDSRRPTKSTTSVLVDATTDRTSLFQNVMLHDASVSSRSDAEDDSDYDGADQSQARPRVATATDAVSAETRKDVATGNARSSALNPLSQLAPLVTAASLSAATSTTSAKLTPRYTTLVVGAADSADVIASSTSSAAADRDDVLAPIVLPRLSEEDSLRAEPCRDFLGIADATAAADAAGSCRYVFSCSSAQNALPAAAIAPPIRLGLGARLMDLGSVGGDGDYLYVDINPRASPAPPPWAGTLQRGVLRTNCVDCLDRTNVSQVQVGAHVLGLQLHALGLSATTSVDPSSPYVRVMMELYEAHGDAIAMQYGGSEANKKVSATAHEAGMRAGDAVEAAAPTGGGGGGEVTSWRLGILGGPSAKLSSSGPSEILTSLQRYYSNSFTDSVKQDAINLALGIFRPRRAAALFREEVRARGELEDAAVSSDRVMDAASGAGPVQLWDIESDAVLHRVDILSERGDACAPGDTPWGGTGAPPRVRPLPPELPATGADWWTGPLAAFDARCAATKHTTVSERTFIPQTARFNETNKDAEGMPSAAVAAGANDVRRVGDPATGDLTITYFDEILTPLHCSPQEAAHVVMPLQNRAAPRAADAAPQLARPPARPPPPPPPPTPPAAPIALSAPRVSRPGASGLAAKASSSRTGSRGTLALKNYGESLFADILPSTTLENDDNLLQTAAPSSFFVAALTLEHATPSPEQPLALRRSSATTAPAPRSPLVDARLYNPDEVFPVAPTVPADTADRDVFERVAAFAEHARARKLIHGLAAVDAAAAADAAEATSAPGPRARPRDTFIITTSTQIELFRASLATSLGSDAAITLALSDTVRAGPYAGENGKRLAAPLIASAMRRGEAARTRAYVEYVGGGGTRSAPALLTLPVERVGISVVTF
jgi:hypothetical protein